MYNIPHGGFFKNGAETAKRKCNVGTSKWRQIGDAIDIAKDYRTATPTGHGGLISATTRSAVNGPR